MPTNRRHPSILAAAAMSAALLMLFAGGSSADPNPARGLPAPPPVGDGTGSVALSAIGDGNFASPVNVAFAPGEPGNVYVVEQDGLVKVVAGGVEQAAPFLDLTGVTNGAGERGLLALAFHPDYAANDFVYAYYTHAGTGDIVVAELTAADPLDADENSRRTVIRIKHRMASNHNGGQLLFGPDSHLYMGTGDGGGAGDPRENAQSKRSLLGKLLRINPLAKGQRRYTTPKGNPFKGRKGRNEIYARGLRNPFRFSFDAETKRIAIGDVGQDRFEEVDYEGPKTLRGANFGWDRWEGFKRYRGAGDNEARTPKRKHHDKPIFAYGRNHCGGGCSVIGGVVVRDASLTNLYGRYLFADAYAGRLRSFVPNLSGAKDVRYLDQGPVGFPTSFAADPETAEIYVTTAGGAVHRFEPAP